MEPLISVIIPVFNVEKYLDYCMQSVLAQEFKNLEIILVDDGSTDSSGSMCDEYAKKDSRVRVVHKSNGGLSSARNAGNRVMTGEYLTYIDSDDYIRADYISRLYKYIVEDGTDMVVCSVKKVIGDEDFHNIPETSAEHFVFYRDDIKYKMVSRQVPMYAHGRLYRAALVERLNFPEGRLFEDVPTSWNVIKYVDKVTYAKDEIYFYRQRLDSIVNARYKHGRMDQVYFAEQIYQEVYDDARLGVAAGSRCFFSAADNYALVSKDFPEDRDYLKKVLKKHRKEVLRDQSSGNSMKIMALCTYLSTGLVRFLGRTYKKSNLRKWKRAE